MSEPLLEARGLVKSFGRVHALRGADFLVNRGEVVALIGDNGLGTIGDSPSYGGLSPVVKQSELPEQPCWHANGRVVGITPAAKAVSRRLRRDSRRPA